MTNRELIKELLDHPLDSQVYVSKGVGPVNTVHSEVTDRIWIVLSP